VERHGHILKNHKERKHQMKEIEDITGSVPLFIRYLVESDNDNETFDFRKNRLIEKLNWKIQTNLSDFSLEKLQSESEYDRNRYVLYY
jgi:hypothetical protein